MSIIAAQGRWTPTMADEAWPPVGRDRKRQVTDEHNYDSTLIDMPDDSVLSVKRHRRHKIAGLQSMSATSNAIL